MKINSAYGDLVSPKYFKEMLGELLSVLEDHPPGPDANTVEIPVRGMALTIILASFRDADIDAAAARASKYLNGSSK